MSLPAQTVTAIVMESSQDGQITSVRKVSLSERIQQSRELQELKVAELRLRMKYVRRALDTEPPV